MCLLCHTGLLICKCYKKCIWLTAPLLLAGSTGALGAVLWISRKSPLLPVNKWHGSVLCDFLLGRCCIFCDLSFTLYFNRLLINGVNLKLPVLRFCFIPPPPPCCSKLKLVFVCICFYASVMVWCGCSAHGHAPCCCYQRALSKHRAYFQEYCSYHSILYISYVSV